MDASTVAVLLLATVPVPVTAPADSLREPLLRVLAHPDSAQLEYEHDAKRAMKMLDSEEAWNLAALLGTESKAWSLPAVREEWCTSTPKSEHRVRLEFSAGANHAVVLIDLQRAWAVLGPVVGANTGYQDLHYRWRPLIGRLRATFPEEGAALKSVRPCPRNANSYRPPAPVPPTELAFLGLVDELPEVIEKTKPEYPQIAREVGVDGVVMVHALVGSDGRVLDTRVVKSIPMLDQAAMDCVRKWKFRPARSRGQAVSVWFVVTVRFSL